MTSPAPTPAASGSRFPWKTIGGVLLWALGVILHQVLPQNPPALATGMQSAGIGLGGFGAVAAMADFIKNAKFLRFSQAQSSNLLQVVMMLGGSWYYALTHIVGTLLTVAPATHTALVVSGAAAAATSVTGWRLWLHNLVQQSKA